MEPPSDYPESDGSLPLAVKLLIMVASLGVASLVGFYLHPHLLPFLSHSIPAFWSSAQGWLTTPILFLLLNVVVGTLYFSSSMFSRPESRPEPPRGAAPARSFMVTKDPPAAPPQAEAAPVVNASRSGGGLRARIEKSKTFSRLVRSKSELIPPSVTTRDVAVGGASRLKKAGTFEVAAKAVRKPMVIVADPPEDESGAPPPPGHEEVDKKAEDFISRFYQRVKLQRLDSLLRSQQQGPPA